MKVNPFRRESDPFAARRYSDVLSGRPLRARKGLRRWQQALVSLLVVLLGVGAFGLWQYDRLQDRLHAGGPSLSQEEEGEPFNVLLVGSDSRGDLTPKEQERLGAKAIEGDRADTLIIAHIDPRTDKAIMVQFPRDLYVPIAGGGRDRINSALLEGTETLVRTVQQVTGLEINRYIEINIAAFRDLVDAIGGVDICITEPIPFDPRTGIEIKPQDLGMVHFDGDKALRFVRSRNFETGDFARIRNQQKFLAAAVRKLTSTGTLLRPDRVLELIAVAGDNLRTDVEMSPTDLRDLLDRFQAFDPGNYEAYTVPNLGIGTRDGASIVVPYRRGMKVLFQAVKANESPAEYDGVPEIDPTTIEIGVYNGAGPGEAVAAAADKLRRATDPAGGGENGVQIAEVADAPSFSFTRTIVRYRPGAAQAQERAELVASVVRGAGVEAGRVPGPVDVAVIVGNKPFRAKRLVQLTPLEIPPPSRPPAECRR